LIVCGCTVPRSIFNALDVQTRYTRVYVEATLPLLRSSNLDGSRELEGILEASQGRAFILFTSYKQMEQVAEAFRKGLL